MHSAIKDSLTATEHLLWLAQPVRSTVPVNDRRKQTSINFGIK